jgi:hypothetical protein
MTLIAFTFPRIDPNETVTTHGYVPLSQLDWP